MKNSEVILTFGFESLKSFLSDTPNSRIAMQRIGLEPYIDWQRLELLKRNGLWHHLIQEQLSIAIKHASGAQHMTLFFVTPKKGWSYWLVHLSKQYRARAVMLDVHWESANNGIGNFEHRLGDGIFGLGFKASKIPGQATLDFGDVMSFDEVGKLRCISALTRDLSDFIHQQQPINFKKMIDLLSDLTAANEESIRQAIQNGIDHKEIIVTNSETGRERKAAKQIKPDDILSAPQRALFSFRPLPR